MLLPNFNQRWQQYHQAMNNLSGSKIREKVEKRCKITSGHNWQIVKYQKNLYIQLPKKGGQTNNFVDKFKFIWFK